MATEALKSTPITNLDATPPLDTSPGMGGLGLLRSVEGSVTATTAVTLGSTYRMCRVPSNAKIKHIYVGLDATVTTFTVDIGAYYSTSTVDGTSAANVAAAATAISAAFFGSAIALASIVTPTDYVNESGTNTAAKRMQPLWQALAL